MTLHYNLFILWNLLPYLPYYLPQITGGPSNLLPFLPDAVAEERAALRIDMNNSPELRSQFDALAESDKKQVENEEDRLLSVSKLMHLQYLIHWKDKNEE